MRCRDPDLKVETIKPKAFRPPKDWSNRARCPASFLACCAKPQNRSPRAILPYSYLLSGLKSDQRLLRLMTKRVGVALRGQRENGIVRCDQGPGHMLWEINR